MSKTVLVTGAAGFVGHALSHRLLDENYNVIGIDCVNDYYDPQLKERRLQTLTTRPEFTFYRDTITDLDRVKQILEKHSPQVIFHLAAQAGVRYSISNPLAYEKANTHGTLAILEAAKQTGINRIVMASSSSVYGANTKIPFSESDKTDSPVSLYAATKKATEGMAHVYSYSYGMHITCLRFFTVYGPWGRPDMAYFNFSKLIEQGKPIPVFNNGNMTRDFTYISDIVDGIILAWKNSKEKYDVFNLGNDKPEKLMDMIDMIEKEIGKPAQKIMKGMQTGDVLTTYADLTKSRQLLGYNPKTTLKQGLHEFAKWFKENKEWLLKLETPK